MPVQGANAEPHHSANTFKRGQFDREVTKVKHIPRVTYVEGAVPTITFGLDTSQKWGSAPTITFDLDTTVVIGFRFPACMANSCHFGHH